MRESTIAICEGLERSRTIISTWYNRKLFGYLDVDWVGDASDQQTTLSYMFSLRSTIVAWSSKKQSIVALSRTEPEYRGAIVATYEVIWL